MWDIVSVVKSTGGVRLVGPEVRMSKRGSEEGNSTAFSVGKPVLNCLARKQTFKSINYNLCLKNTYFKSC